MPKFGSTTGHPSLQSGQCAPGPRHGQMCSAPLRPALATSAPAAWVFGITRMHGSVFMCLDYQTRKLTSHLPSPGMKNAGPKWSSIQRMRWCDVQWNIFVYKNIFFLYLDKVKYLLFLIESWKEGIYDTFHFPQSQAWFIQIKLPLYCCSWSLKRFY